MSLLDRVRTSASSVRATVESRLPTREASGPPAGPALPTGSGRRIVAHGAAAVAVTLLATVLLTALGWALGGGSSAGSQVLGVGAAAWLLLTGGGLVADGITVTLVPLLGWGAAVWVSTHALERAADDVDAPLLAVLPRFLAGYAAGVAAVVLLTLTGPARPSWWGLLTALGVPLAATVVAEVRAPDPAIADRIPVWLERAVRPAGWGVAGLAALAGLTVLALLAVRWETVTGLYAALGPGVGGGLLLSLVQLLYLPDLLVWAVAVLAGPGFQVSAGGTVSLAGSHPGLLPLVPALGLVPPDAAYPGWARLGMLLPVAVGALVGWRATTAWTRLAATRSRVLTVAAAVGIVGLLALVLALLASGSAGGHRLALLGPQPWAFAAALTGELAVGAGLWLGADTLRRRLWG